MSGTPKLLIRCHAREILGVRRFTPSRSTPYCELPISISVKKFHVTHIARLSPKLSNGGAM